MCNSRGRGVDIVTVLGLGVHDVLWLLFLEPSHDRLSKYWRIYLKKRYAGDFSALARELEQQTDGLVTRYPDGGDDYISQCAELSVWIKKQRSALIIRLTRQERAEAQI